MTKLEMVQAALSELGGTSAENLVAFVEKKFGVTIEPKFIPLYKATLRFQRTAVNKTRPERKQ